MPDVSDVAEFHRHQCLTRRAANVRRGITQPDGTSDRIPLRRALEAIGHARFGDEWTGLELDRLITPELPAPITSSVLLSLFDDAAQEREDELVRWYSQPNGEAIEYAELLLRRLAPAVATPARGMLGSPSWPPEPPRFTRLQWRTAQNLAAAHMALIKAAWDRALQAEHLFKQACIEQKLKTYLRPLIGGPFSETMPWWVWNGEEIWRRFGTYRMCPNDYFSVSDADIGTHWIFVDATDLRSFVSAFTKANGALLSNAEAEWLSPYLTHMIQVSRLLTLSPSNMPKKDVIVAELSSRWAGEQSLTTAQLSYMATFLRDFESQAGRASIHRKASSKTTPKGETDG